MTARIELKGGDDLRRSLARLTGRAAREVKKAVDATGLSLAGDVRRRYQRGPATGVVYEKTNPSRTHQASAPGEAPATDTGRLASSVTIQDIPGTSGISVGTDVVYGPWLEYGTQDGKIAARPAWRPAVEAERDKYWTRLHEALRRASR